MPEVYSQNGKCLNTGTFIDVKCDAKKYKKEIKALKKNIYIYSLEQFNSKGTNRIIIKGISLAE